jgi:predicted GH43/DUF377 family glycosyl hydrolase
MTASASIGSQTTPVPVRPPADTFAWLRGANYVPSYARNDVQTWMDYDPAVVDRELSYAAKLNLNCVRVFLQVAVYEHDRKRFLENFENFLVLCDKHRIRMMPVIFDSCFGEFPDLEGYRDKDWMACPGQNRLGPEHWPAMQRFVRDVVGGHKDDHRIVMWDVMNEPTCTSFYKQPEAREAIHTFLKQALDWVKAQQPSQPRTVGLMRGDELHLVQDQVEVLSFHNYRKDLRDEIRRIQDLGRQLGKPVLVNEVVMRPKQTFDLAMPILREEKIGWVFWELMLGKTQFSRGENPIQGLVYPDGKCRDAREIAAVMNISVEEAGQLFPPAHPGPGAPGEDKIQYSPGWTLWHGQGPQGGRLYFANGADCTASWEVNGGEVTLVHKVGPDCGIARVLVDGEPAAVREMDTYAPTVDWGRHTRLAQNLTPGRHVITVVVTGKKNARSSNSYVQIVGFVDQVAKPAANTGEPVPADAPASPAALKHPTGTKPDLSRFHTPHKLNRYVLTKSDDPKDFDSVYATCPFVFSAHGRFYMTYVGHDGIGYQTGLAESDDLVNWKKLGLIIGRDATSSFRKYSIGLTSLLRENDLASSGDLKKVNGRYLGSWLAFPQQGHEAGPAVIGLAWSDDLKHWALTEPVLRPEDGADWERGGLYKSYLLEANGTYYLFYNAKDKTTGGWREQTGVATSRDLKTWTRSPRNPVIPNGPKGSLDERFASDPVVMRAGSEWALFYFGLAGDNHARELLALSSDLERFEKASEVLVDIGERGSLDGRHAHKPSVITWRGDLYHFYDAVSDKVPGGPTQAVRGISVARSRSW